MRFVKPLDEEVVLEMAGSHSLLVTVEENVIMGGAGSAVNECIARHGKQVAVLNLGVPDRHLEHGSQQQQLSEIGLDASGIQSKILEALSQHGFGKKNIPGIKAVS
jgi:1-deoxy-D-xylulose-5-phosphate synthase